MISISNKTKHFLVFIIKVLIVIGAFYFIYNQLANNRKLNLDESLSFINNKLTVFEIIFILFLSVANRFLEILKWQNLVSIIKTIQIGTAINQVLGALTAGIFTPNGVGEYAGKALYFDKKYTKKIFFLNLICNGIQMILTVFFGTLGLFFLGYWLEGLLIIGSCFTLFMFLYFNKNTTIKGYSIQSLLKKTNDIPKKIHLKNNALAIGRYLVFSHQYYILFLLFGVDLPYFTLMSLIASVYFIASALPSFQFLDFAVKGSIAVYLFSKFGINQWIVVFVSTLMWLLNVVLPVIIGSYFVLKFKPKWN